jgi:membrane protease YdiL (CAAX protease family)
MNNNKFFPRTILQSIAFIGLFIIFVAVTIGFCLIIGFKDILSSNHGSIILIVIDLTVYIAVFHVINTVKGSRIDYGFRFSNLALIPIMILILFVFEFGVIALIKGFILNNNDIQENPFNSIYFLLGALFFAPILEEFLFRGFILKGLLITYSFTKAIVFSAIIFALVHVNLVNINFLKVVNAFIIGLYLGWIYYKTNSLILTISLHFISNLFGLAIDYLRFLFSDLNNYVTSFYNIGFKWFVFCLSFFLIFLFVKQLSQKINLLPTEKEGEL